MTYRELCQRDAGDDGGDVVGATLLVGALDETLDAFLRAVVLDNFSHLVVGDEAGETVGAEQESVPALHGFGVEVDFNIGRSAEAAVDDVAFLVRARLLFCERTEPHL